MNSHKLATAIMRTKLSVPEILHYESAEDDFVTLYGIENTFDQTYHPVSSQLNGGQTYFSFNPLSTETVMDRLILLECTVKLPSPATDANGIISPLGRLCPKSWPLNSAIRNLEVRINGSSITSQPYKWKTTFERLNTKEDIRKRFMSFTPTFRDNHVDYYRMASERFANSPFSPIQHIKTDETPRSEWPLEEESISFKPARAAALADLTTFPPTPAVAQLAAARTPTNVYKFTEPLLIDLFEVVNSSGIHNVNKVEIIITWMNNMFDCMFSDPRVITAVDNVDDKVTTTQALALTQYGVPVHEVPLYVAPLLTEYQPTASVIANDPVPIPLHRPFYFMSSGSNVIAGPANRNSEIVYDTSRAGLEISAQKIYVRYAKPINELSKSLVLPHQDIKVYNIRGTAGSKTITLPLIKETVAPRFGIVHIKRRISTLGDVRVADTFFRINSLNLQVNEQTGIFSNMSRQKLWLMSTNNGLDCSWLDWEKYGQSIAIFEFGNDIGGVIPSVIGQFSLQLTATFENQFTNYATGATIDYTPELELFLIFEGELEITPDSMRKKIGYTRADLAANSDTIYSSQSKHKIGGSLKTNSYMKMY
jgi:hypothetical protein